MVYKTSALRGMLVFEIILDLFAAFMMITKPVEQVGIYLGIVLYARGLFGLLMSYVMAKKEVFWVFILDMFFLTIGAYFLFGGKTYLDVLVIVLSILMLCLGIFFLFFGIRAQKKD